MTIDRTPPLYIESDHFRRMVGGASLKVVDAGSRGGLFEPLASVSADVRATGFDPDPDTVGDGSIPRALWSETGPLEVHLAVDPSTSSVYPPDLELLAEFPHYIGLGARSTDRVIEVPATSIDDAIAEGLLGTPHLIKLDVHSAEYEVLEGADSALGEVLGVLVESWHVPIHAGQHLHGDLESLLNRHGLYMFDTWPMSEWPHTVDNVGFRSDRPRRSHPSRCSCGSFATSRRLIRRPGCSRSRSQTCSVKPPTRSGSLVAWFPRGSSMRGWGMRSRLSCATWHRGDAQPLPFRGGCDGGSGTSLAPRLEGLTDPKGALE